MAFAEAQEVIVQFSLHTADAINTLSGVRHQMDQ